MQMCSRSGGEGQTGAQRAGLLDGGRYHDLFGGGRWRIPLSSVPRLVGKTEARSLIAEKWDNKSEHCYTTRSNIT